MTSKLRFPPPKGFVAPGFEDVLNTFRDSFSKGIDKGATFAAFYRGKPVVHIWGGLADEEVKRPWKEHTMGFLHSTTKFAAAITIAHMIDRGLLRYDQKISSIWPEFAQNGKEDITLETFMSLRSGLPVLSENFEISWLRDDPRRLCEVLEKQEPLWPPGEAHGYHVLTIGLYLDQIVRRVDRKKRSLSQYFQEEIAEPFGIELYIGLPKPLHHRVARLTPRPIDRQNMELKVKQFKGDPVINQLSLTQPKDWFSTRRLNDPDFMELPCPSSHGVGTALAVAKLTGIMANGGEHDGKRLLSPESIARMQEPLSYGTDKTLSGSEIYSRGTILQPVVEGTKSWYMFGHSGFGDQNSAADPHYKVGWAYLTNYADPNVSMTNENKWRPLVESLFSCVHRLEGVQCERKMLTSFEELQREKSLTNSKL
ncbi:beta-lactamase domain-containing protein 2 [Aplysia californica]|uniref:Beta-lactamase domain-containing protein 2 n=1 Tax=Aplysia californica TaxID=6500 RepID=A0ABM0JF78_APLCA|nr:beta-lactamase domain-containing protein 2 [Aplysia californica]XP_035824065.1 beta-lactamase domain-containing protein 2 [Aplysia californica]